MAGHICLDLTPKFSNQKMENPGNVLIPGKLVKVGDVDIHTGGSVANTGLAMKIFGADVSLMGKVGKDDFGDTVKRALEKYDAEKNLIVSEESSTSYSIVLAVAGSDRIFLHNPGANDTFSYNDINWKEVEGALLFHFGYPPIMKRMYEQNGEELVRIFKEAKRLGAVTSLDMAAVDAASEAGRADWDSILHRVLPYVDFFVPSVEELCFMLDRAGYDGWTEQTKTEDILGTVTLGEVEALAQKALACDAGWTKVQNSANWINPQSNAE